MVSARKAVIYLAGDKEACAKAERVVAGFADSCLYFGPFGAASRVKLVNNLLVAINIAATAEAMALGLKAGVDVDLMIKAIATGSGGSTQFGIRAPWMAQRRFLPAQGTVPGLQHYFDMIGEFADSVGVATPHARPRGGALREVHGDGLRREGRRRHGRRHRRAAAPQELSSTEQTRPEVRMIRVKKIAHAIYEMPDVDKQIEYYTEILGLTRDRQGQGRGLSRLDRRSPLGGAAQGRAGEMRAPRLPDRARRRSQRVREAGPGPRRQDRAQEGSGAFDLRHGHVRGPEGHGHGGVQARRVRRPALPDQGHRAAQARPRRLPRHRRQARRPSSIATCSASANPTGWGISSRSCAAVPTTTPST